MLYCQNHCHEARLAQSVEHETLNLRVVGSSPTLGEILFSILTLKYIEFEATVTLLVCTVIIITVQNYVRSHAHIFMKSSPAVKIVWFSSPDGASNFCKRAIDPVSY